MVRVGLQAIEMRVLASPNFPPPSLDLFDEDIPLGSEEIWKYWSWRVFLTLEISNNDIGKNAFQTYSPVLS